MCIISNRVESVSKTKLFVGAKPLTNRQITVYANSVDNLTDGNAMILPVPFPNTVRFHDLSNYTNFFDDCDNCFLKPKLKSLSNSYGVDGFSTNSKTLEVFNVGSYQVSLAKSLDDLQRVNKSVFILSNGCDELLRKYYSNPNFGFIICKLATGKEDYHPFGYSHIMIDNNKMFIPTKHYHEHGFNRSNYKSNYESNIESSPMFQNFMSDFTFTPNITEDWDHDIYLYNGSLEHNRDFYDMSKRGTWSGSNLKNKNKLDFDLGDLLHFEKHKVRGHKKNIDLIAVVNTVPNNYMTMDRDEDMYSNRI